MSNAQKFTEYDALSPIQKVLIQKWSEKSDQARGKSGSARQKFESLSVSEHSVFEAISNALLNTKLTDKNGRSIGRAIDLVSGIDVIAGQDQTKGSDEQYRLYVTLLPGARDKLEASREFSRGKDNTVFHHGYPINYRQDGKPPTMQFSITNELDRADIDVDYRSSGFPSALFNGHLTAGNSDVRVDPNYSTHLTRWRGLVKWWEQDVASFFTKIFGGNTRAPKPQMVESRGDGKFPDATAVAITADQFLKTWLVDADVDSAIKNTSARLAACVDLDSSSKGLETLLRQRRRILLYETLKAVNKQIGKVKQLSDAIASVDTHDKDMFAVDHTEKRSFMLAHITNSYYQHFVCDNIGFSGYNSTADRDKKYGDYYMTVLRLKLKNEDGGVLKLIWTKENNVWKIITFDAVSA